MKKSFIGILLILILAGCENSRYLDQAMIDDGQKKCQPNSGLSWFGDFWSNLDGNWTATVHCMNGASFHIERDGQALSNEVSRINPTIN